MIDSTRLARIMAPDFHLRGGMGTGINGQMDACAQQALRYILGLDSASDACPDCVSPVIHSFSMSLNDKMPQDYRDKLKDYLAMQTGTKGTLDLDICRAFKIGDHAVRFTAANVLENAGLKDRATTLRSLPEIADAKSSSAASYAARAASSAARAASYAASSASSAASSASSAARAASYAARAASYAARAASYAARAASYAARAASYAASSAASDARAASIWDAELALLKQLCEMKDEP